MNQMELTILDFIQEHMRNAFLDVGMPFVSTLGNAGIIWIALTVVLLISKKHRKTGTHSPTSSAFGSYQLMRKGLFIISVR